MISPIGSSLDFSSDKEFLIYHQLAFNNIYLNSQLFFKFLPLNWKKVSNASWKSELGFLIKKINSFYVVHRFKNNCEYPLSDSKFKTLAEAKFKTDLYRLEELYSLGIDLKFIPNQFIG